MSRSTRIARKLAAFAAAAFITAVPTTAMAHGGADDEFTTGLVDTNVVDSGSKVSPLMIGGGAAAVVMTAAGVAVFIRRKK